MIQTFSFTSKGDAKIFIANLCNHLMLDVSSAPSTILSCQKAFCPKLPLLVMDAKKIVILYELPIQYLSNTNPVPVSYLQIVIKWHCSISTLQRNWSRRSKWTFSLLNEMLKLNSQDGMMLEIARTKFVAWQHLDLWETIRYLFTFGSIFNFSFHRELERWKECSRDEFNLVPSNM